MTTVREARNRAADQQGSTTEASDQGSDLGVCLAPASRVKSQAKVSLITVTAQGSTSSQTGEGW